MSWKMSSTHKEISAIIPLKSREGTDVKRSMGIMQMASGRWPSLEPTKKSLEAATMEALRPPKQDSATASGIVQLNIPKIWSAKV
jgi:hypothetical protein